MTRRHRLSRSRDFDAVYRQGRSVSTRFLVLYWFARETRTPAGRARAWASRSRGRSATPSPATGSSGGCARSSARARPSCPHDNDYVLVVRPGLAEAAETRGFDWLTERVDEILEKAAA